MPPLPRLHRYCTALRLPCSLGPHSGSPRSGLPHGLVPPRGEQGPPRLLGRPLPACRGLTPRRVLRPLALPNGGGAAAFRLLHTLGTRNASFSGLYPRGPHARGPTHQRPRYRSRCKDSLPACRAQLWPGGFRTRWTTHRLSRSFATSFPIGPAYPGRSTRPDPISTNYPNYRK